MNRHWPVAVLFLSLAVSAQAQYVEDSVYVGTAAVSRLAYNSRHDVVYGVSTLSLGRLFAIQCSTGQVICNLPLNTPTRIVYDSVDDKAYCSFGPVDGESLLVVDGRSHGRIRTIPMASVNGLAWYGPTDRLYVSLGERDKVAVVDCRTDEVVGLVNVGQWPSGLDFNRAQGKLYVRNWDDASISVVDMESNLVIKTIYIGSEPSSGWFSESLGKYYCGSNHVAVVSGSGDSVLAQIHMPVGTSVMALAGSEEQGFLFAGGSTGGTDSVYVIDMGHDSIVSVLPVGREPHALARSQTTGLIYCANSVSDNVSVIASNGVRVVTTLPAGDYPCTFAVSPATRRVYVGAMGGQYVYVVSDTATGISEGYPRTEARSVVRATVVRGAGWMNIGEPGIVMDAAGRRVAEIGPGRARPRLAPGIYFVREAQAQAQAQAQIVRKIVVLK